MTFEEAHYISTTASSSMVLHLFLLDFVQQVQGLIKVACVGTPVIGALQDTDLTCPYIIVLIQKDVQFGDGVSRADKFLLYEV